MVKGYIWSILLYGTEAWTLNKRDIDRIEAFEMWLMRRILRISWVERITNQEVLQRMNCNRENLSTIKKRKTAYFNPPFNQK